MDLNDYKVILYRNQPDGWVAEVPAIEGCYALVPTRQKALSGFEQVFDMIAAGYRDKGLPRASGYHRNRECLALAQRNFVVPQRASVSNAGVRLAAATNDGRILQYW